MEAIFKGYLLLQQHGLILQAHHNYLQQQRLYRYHNHQDQLQEYQQRPLSIDIPRHEYIIPGHQQQRPDLLIPATNAGAYQVDNSIDICFSQNLSHIMFVVLRHI